MTTTGRELSSLFISSFFVMAIFGGLLASAMLFLVDPMCPAILKLEIAFFTIVSGMIVIGRGFFLKEIYMEVVS